MLCLFNYRFVDIPLDLYSVHIVQSVSEVSTVQRTVAQNLLMDKLILITTVKYIFVESVNGMESDADASSSNATAARTFVETKWNLLQF